MYLGGIEVDDPVLETDCASERDNNGVLSGHVAGEAEDIKDGVVEGLALSVITCTFVTLL